MTKRTLGHRAGDLERRRQLARPDQQVVREARARRRRGARDDVGAQEPLGVRLVVDLVADADEAVAARARAEGGERRSATAGLGEVDPADHARDERRRPRRSQELAASRRRLDRVWTRTVASMPAAARAAARGRRARIAGGSPRGRRSATGSRRAPGPRSGGGRRRSRSASCGHRRRIGAASRPSSAELGPKVGRDRAAASAPGSRRGGRCVGRRRPARRPPGGRAGTGWRRP